MSARASPAPTQRLIKKRAKSGLGVHRDPEGTERVRKVAIACEKEKKPFVDKEFPPSESSIWKDPKNKGDWLVDETIKWLRPDEIGDQIPWGVFRSGPQAEDILQGAVGDCYLLAALSTMAQRPHLIDNMVIEDYCDYGIYGVKFFRMGRWETIIVDDLFPCRQNPNTGQWTPLFASYTPPDKEIWMMLAEKAWAKMHGCYQVIAYGQITDALCYLTGGHSALHDFEDSETWLMVTRGVLWSKLYKVFSQRTDENGVFIGCSGVNDFSEGNQVGGISTGNGGATGLASDHAYSVLDMKQIDNLQLIKVRNPWGTFAWKGDYGEDSDLWTPELKRQCNFVKKNDGSFWMRFQDFCAYFTFMSVCRIHGSPWQFQSLASEWRAGCSAGGRTDDTFQYNPIFDLSVTGRKVIIQLEQPDIRHKPPHEMWFLDLFVNVIAKVPKSAPMMEYTVVGLQHEIDSEPGPFRLHSNVRLKNFEMLLEPGQYQLVVTQFHRGVEGKFAIHVFADAPFEFVETTAQNVPKTVQQLMKRVSPADNGLKCCMSGAKIDLSDINSYKCRKGVFWHIKGTTITYRCGSCLKPFVTTSPFFDVGKEDAKPNWMGYCGRCFREIFFPKCAVCKKSIHTQGNYTGQFVSVTGGRVHRECWLEFQVRTSRSNLVCQVPLQSGLADTTVAVVVRVQNNENTLAKLQALVDTPQTEGV